LTGTGANIEPRNLPLEEQRLILRAALERGLAGREAALAWLPQADIDSMQFESLKVLPQLYDRLRTEGIEDPLLPRLKGLKKRVWLSNQLLFRAASEAICHLQQAGIDVMVIKGLAMVVGYYGDYSQRSMGDADLLVRCEDARKACEVLSRRGWTSEYADAEDPRRSEWAFQHGHAAHLLNSQGKDLDLHWNLLVWRVGPEVDEDFWAASNEASFGGRKVRILNPADQLLHICVHGTDLAPICWISDAVVVLRSTPNLDWDRLLTQAQKRNLALMVGNALLHVRHEFANLVPSQVMTELLRLRVPIFERCEYRALTIPRGRAFGLRMLFRFLCLSRGMNLLDWMRLIPGFLCVEFKVPSKSQLPAAFFRKTAEEIVGCFVRRSRRAARDVQGSASIPCAPNSNG